MTRLLSELPRFDYVAETITEALEYYRNRVTSLLSSGWSWNGCYKNLGWGIHVKLENDGTLYDSVYVLDRNKGHLLKWFNDAERNFVCMDECQKMLQWLIKNDIEFIKACRNNSDAYDYSEKFCGNRRAKRTNVFYMSHVDEGLYILDRMQSSGKIISEFTRDAYSLHVALQADNDLSSFYENECEWGFIDTRSIILAMEYRNVANSYLSFRNISSTNDIKLSTIHDVNIMLWADKIQNRKDFERYHLGTHPQSGRLAQYFENWFERLEIPEDFYTQMVSEINKKTGISFG